MGCVKGGAYGSGLLPVVETLLEKGVEELAVATVGEAVYLRNHGVQVPITVLGESVAAEASNQRVTYRDMCICYVICLRTDTVKRG